MRSVLFILMGCLMAQAADTSSQNLARELRETGLTAYSDLEVALIAGGVEGADALAAQVTAYEAMMEKMALTGSKAKMNAKKKPKVIHKKLFTWLRKAEPTSTAIDQLVAKRIYSPLTATYIYVDLSRRSGLKAADYGQMQENLDPSLLALEGDDVLRRIASALFAARAVELPENETSQARKLLDISRLLAPENPHGKGFIDVRLYNRVLKLYNADQLEAACELAVGAAARFPEMEAFEGLCYNIGIKLFQTTAQNKEYQRILPLGEQLQPFTGQYKDGYAKTVATVYYNHAVELFNNGKFDLALAELEKADTDQPSYQQVLVGSLLGQIEAHIEADKPDAIPALMARLEQADAEKWERMKTRISQLKMFVNSATRAKNRRNRSELC